MKTKNLIFLLAMLLAVSPLIAQFGFQGGVDFGSLKAEEDGESEKFGSKVGFTFGFLYQVPVGKQFAFQPELNFIQKGGRESMTFLDQEIETSFVLNYLEMPLYFMYTGGKPTGFFAGLGPSFNFGLSGKLKASYDGQEESEDLDFGEDLNGFHMGLNAQAGYTFGNGFLVNGFLSQTLTNSAPSDESDAVKINMFTFGLRIGYKVIKGGSSSSRRLKEIF